MGDDFGLKNARWSYADILFDQKFNCESNDISSLTQIP